MKTGYMSPLMSLPKIITEPGKYLTRCGDLVVVNTIGHVAKFSCAGSYSNGVKESWHRSGRLFANVISDNDIVTKVEYEITY